VERKKDKMSTAKLMRKKDGTYIHTYSKNIRHEILREGGKEIVSISGYNLSFSYTEK